MVWDRKGLTEAAFNDMVGTLARGIRAAINRFEGEPMNEIMQLQITYAIQTYMATQAYDDVTRILKQP